MRENEDPSDGYDTWFRAKVKEALEDQRPTVPHEEVMRAMRELIDRKRSCDEFAREIGVLSVECPSR